MADQTTSPSLKRDGTMATTAQEGKEFLEGSGFQDGTAKTRGQVTSPPKLSRLSTMEKTAKEAEYFTGGTDHGRTRSATRRKSSAGDTSADPSPTKASPPKKPAMKRAGTMAATAKEGKEFLERKKEEEPAAQPEANTTKANEEPATPKVDTKKANEEPATPKAALKRDSTMEVTAKEGQAFLESQAKAAEPEVPEMKRAGTMVATAEEAKVILGDDAPAGATRAESAAVSSALASEKSDEAPAATGAPVSEKREHDGADADGSDAKRVKE